MRIPVSGKFLLVESEIPGWVLESRIQHKESRITLTIGIRNPRSRIQNPESRTVLDYLEWGEMLIKKQPQVALRRAHIQTI